jgi:hypothetical protein
MGLRVGPINSMKRPTQPDKLETCPPRPLGDVLAARDDDMAAINYRVVL